jgi:hypothetical protein
VYTNHIYIYKKKEKEYTYGPLSITHRQNSSPCQANQFLLYVEMGFSTQDWIVGLVQSTLYLFLTCGNVQLSSWTKNGSPSEEKQESAQAIPAWLMAVTALFLRSNISGAKVLHAFKGSEGRGRSGSFIL